MVCPAMLVNHWTVSKRKKNRERKQAKINTTIISCSTRTVFAGRVFFGGLLLFVVVFTCFVVSVPIR